MDEPLGRFRRGARCRRGTDLWFAAITKLVGAVHHSKGSVDWQVLRPLTLGSLPASIFTLTWLRLAGMGQMKIGFIVNALGVVLRLKALAMVFKNRTHALGQRLRATASEQFKP